MMDQGTAEDLSQSRRLIIERPRLTSLLDQATARVLVLAAPAGYGKTTLAWQWFKGTRRRAAWCQVTSSAIDVVALARETARVIETLAPGCTQHLKERLEASRHTDPDGSELARTLAQGLVDWQQSDWLVLDDYHVLVGSVASEAFVETLVSQAPIRVLILSRQRPTWLTARRLLYGEAQELGANVLAMTQDEAAQVLQQSPGSAVSGLVALAEGWPAVIGLAALAPPPFLDLDDIVPETLHAYFAEELFQAVPEKLKEVLLRLSLAPTINRELATVAWGTDGERVLQEAAWRGFLTHYRSREFDLHPLLRQFLRAKIQFSEPWLRDWIDKLADFFQARSSWDDLFTLSEETHAPGLLDRLIEAALTELLFEGRIATVRRWVAAGRELGLESPQLDLAEAEICFREAKHAASETLASAAAKALSADHPLRSRAFYRAAQSAHLDNRSQAALRLYDDAAAAATQPSDRNQAVWGRFITQAELGLRRDASSTMTELVQTPPTTSEDRLRHVEAQLIAAVRWGGVVGAVEEARRHLHLLKLPSDALVRTSFLHIFGGALCLSAEYEEALKIGQTEDDEARRVGLEFVLPHAWCLKIHAEIGLRRFTDASKALRRVREKAEELNDDHSRLNSWILEARMLLARSMSTRAAEVLDFSNRKWPNPGMFGEVLAMRALACAANGGIRTAKALAAHSARASDQLEAEMPRLWALAIVAYREDGKSRLLEEAFWSAVSTGFLDSIVCAYRSFPAFLKPLAEIPDVRPRLKELLLKSADYGLARKAGLDVVAPAKTVGTVLTDREREVLGLLRQGYSNAEIARALWIENSTAKVHVRHILRKLGVRTRTEAAVLASTDDA